MALFTPATEQRIEAFQRALAWGDHFRLLLVSAAPGPGRTEILHRMRAWSGRDGIPKLVEIHLAAAERPVARIRAAASSLPPGTGIVLVGLDQHITRGEQATPAIRELNFFRDELPEVLPGPLVLIATPDAITNLLSTAPDLVSVRAFTLDIETVTQPPPPTLFDAANSANGTAADVERLTAQLENLERRATPDPAEHSRLLLSLGMALASANQYKPAAERVHQALKLCRRYKYQPGVAHCLSMLGDIELACSNPDAARDAFTEALRGYRRLADRLGEAHCAIGLGRLALRSLDHGLAHGLFQTARDICHAHGAPQEADCSLHLGDLAFTRADHEAACTHYETAMDLFHRHGKLTGEAQCIRGLGRIALVRGDLETAQARFEESLGLDRRAEDRLGEAHGHLELGALADLRSDHAAAMEHLELARTIYLRLGDDHGLAHALVRLGRLGHAMPPAAALERLQEALELYQQIGDLHGQANAVGSMASILLQSDAEPASIRQVLLDAIAMYERIADPLGKANCVLSLGMVELRRGRLLKARSQFREALRLHRRLDNKLSMAHCLVSLGNIDLVRRDFGSALTQCSEALLLYRKIGNIRGEARSLHYIGKVAAFRAEHTEARALFEEAIKLYRQVDDLAAIEQVQQDRDDPTAVISTGSGP